MADTSRVNLLTRITSDRQRRVAEMELRTPGHVLRSRLGIAPPAGRLERALRRAPGQPVRMICEIKRASPSKGVLNAGKTWGILEKVTAAYGYGFSVTALQLAQAYAALADNGRMRPSTFVAGGKSGDSALLDPGIARSVLFMLESVVGPGGTAVKAQVPNYRVAGKTGTSRKAVPGGYQSRYISVFAGVVPATNPRLVGVVVIDDPRGKNYYGGLVAAPVFGHVMPGALRLLNVAPDRLQVQFAGTPVDATAPLLEDQPIEAESVEPFADAGVSP